MTDYTRTLKLDDIDRAGALVLQIDGVLDCISAASHTDSLPDQAIPNACWAASALLEQLRAVFDGPAQPGEVSE